MPFAREAFSRFGEVVAKDGSAFTPADARDAFAIICRSTAKIGPALLEGSNVRFVGSGVAGTDHIDKDYLAARGIEWRAAPGCNALSVANWTMAALDALGVRGGLLGIVGFGNVGSRVEECARAAGFETILNDPPKGIGAPLETLLAEADAVTLHVPLEHGGPFPTYHMISDSSFAAMKPGSVFLNAARGGVLDTAAFLRASSRGLKSAIDCWEGEPSPDARAVAAATIATPHIAGHSFDGKVNGTAAVYRAFCEFAGERPVFDFSLPPPPAGWRYDILADDAAFRASPGSFPRIRASYPESRRDIPPEAYATRKGG